MKNYQDVQMIESPTVKVGNSLLDKLFSAQGGIEWSNFIFLTGTSGAGKTTLCKKLQSLISEHVSVFYSREMMSHLVKKQTLRLEIAHNNAFIADCKDYPHFNDFMNAMDEHEEVKLIIIDSVQHVAADYVASEGLSLEAAMRLVYKKLIDWKNKTNGIVILIGQVTKDGDFQGANFLKQDADAHVHMVFDNKKGIRTIETTKNRMGKLDKLYYEIVDSSETLKFYSEKEFELKDKSIKFDDYLHNVVAEYISTLDKNSEGYKGFSRDLDVYFTNTHSKHMSNEITSSEFIGMVIGKIHELLLKYDLQK